MGKKEEFIADLYPAAMRVSKQTGMSAELILAQAALETGWGEKVLPGTNNIFNIKDSKGWDGPTKTFNVWEIEGGKKVWKDQDFRVYGSIDEALTDRVKFLKENGRYAKAGLFDEGTLGNLEKEAKALQKAGYATDPGYAKQLGEVFNGPTMRRGIALANGRDHGGPDHVEPKPADAKPAPAKPVDAMADGKLKLGEEGKAVTALQ
ncbi:glycoside hydrolase family 73 protein, partial [Lysobacter sp. 2RAB21]